MQYAIRDAGLAGAAGLRGVARTAARQIGRLGRFSPFLLLVAAVAVVVWWWCAGYCDRHPAAGCRDPLPGWARQVGDLWEPPF